MVLRNLAVTERPAFGRHRGLSPSGWAPLLLVHASQIRWTTRSRLACQLALIVAFATALAPIPARAQDGGATLTATPAAVQLAPGAKTSGFLLLANGAGATLEDIVVSTTATTNVDVAVGSQSSDKATPGATVTIPFTLSAPASGARKGAVFFRVGFTVRSVPGGASPAPEAAQPVLGALVASVEVEPVGTTATVAVKGGATAISEISPGTAYVLVTNTSRGPASVTVEPRTNGAVRFEPERLEAAALAPGDTLATSFVIKPRDRVNPGQIVVLFDVTVVTDDGPRHLVDSITTELGVFGASEFSGPLGVPTFYLVPGVIILATWTLLGRFFGPLSKRTLPDASDKGFWVLAVALSLLMAFVIYPVVTGIAAGGLGWFNGVGRDYVRGYGTIDVALAWAVSLAIPSLLYAPLRAWQAYTRRNTPSAKDTPWKLLKKLADANLKVGQPAVTTTSRTEGVLLEQRSGKDEYWIGPQIVIDWHRPPGCPASLEVEADDQLKIDGNVEPLERILAEARKQRAVDLTWAGAGGLTGPLLASATSLTFGPPTLLARRAPSS